MNLSLVTSLLLVTRVIFRSTGTYRIRLQDLYSIGSLPCDAVTLAWSYAPSTSSSSYSCSSASCMNSSLVTHDCFMNAPS